MDIFLLAISFTFSFFFLLLSYWKEDRILNIIGSFALLTIATTLAVTGIQVNSRLNYTLLINNTTDVVANYTTSYNSVDQVSGLAESLGAGFVIVIFTAFQYLYFNWAFKEANRL